MEMVTAISPVSQTSARISLCVDSMHVILAYILLAALSDKARVEGVTESVFPVALSDEAREEDVTGSILLAALLDKARVEGMTGSVLPVALSDDARVEGMTESEEVRERGVTTQIIFPPPVFFFRPSGSGVAFNEVFSLFTSEKILCP